MSIDRIAALRSAEKLLRQGRLDQAIAEYVRVVESQPLDWSTANTLGDLYARAGDIDKAVEQFGRIAENFFREGFLPKAGALYRKILKLKPDDDHALSRAADVAAKQGLLVDARAHLNAIADRQRKRGDLIGAAETVVRLAALDPADYEQRIAGARARFDLLDVSGAVAELKAIADDLTEKNRPLEALDALREAARIDPADAAVTAQLVESEGADEATGRATLAEEAAPLVIAIPPPRVNETQPGPDPVGVPPRSQMVSGATRAPHVEVDLSVVLDDLRSLAPTPEAANELGGDLEDVFARFRVEAERRLSADAAVQDFQRGMTLYRAGQFEEAAPILEHVSRVPRFRFEAGLTLGRMCRARGQVWGAIDWLERAAQAPAPSAEENHQLLYELADLLESAGEVARALAICLELQAEAGAYEDVVDRVERLARVQAAG